MIIYLTVAITLIGMISLYMLKKIKLSARFVVIVYLFAVAFGFTFEITFCLHLKLFHYYKPSQSPYWILIMGLLVYPAFHIVYLNFLVSKLNLTRWLTYTTLWVVFMLAFEYVTILLDIVVFTGWDMWPWSTVTYIVVFLSDTLLYLWMKPELRTTIYEKA